MTCQSLQLIFFIISARTLFIDCPVSEVSLACQLFLKSMHNPGLKELRFAATGTLLTCFQQAEVTVMEKLSVTEILARR